ncbi:MAG: GxxExxY protein [Verrucomicrobiales bacterium]|jgi:GxxExxY protein
MSFEPRMDTNEHELVLWDEVYAVVGCAMTVLNELGHCLLEKPYENVLVVEFGHQGIPSQQQPRFPVVYKKVTVGEYIPDLITHEQVVVDAKVIERIGDHEVGQVMNYLKTTGLKVALILNFKHAKLEWKRVVL